MTLTGALRGPITTKEYGVTKKIICIPEEINIKPRHDDEGCKGTESDRYGDQGEAGAYNTYKPDCPFKDSRKWRTQTKEQAR